MARSTRRSYARGRHALAECQRSGQKMRYRDLVEDGHVPGLLVHPDWWEPKHPQEIPISVDDPVALWRPAPEISKPPGEGDDPRTGCCNLDASYPANTTTSGTVELGQTVVGVNDALRFDYAQGARAVVYIQMDDTTWYCSPIVVPIRCTPTYTINLSYPFDGASPISAGAKVVAGNDSSFVLAAAAVPSSLTESISAGNESAAIALNASGGVPPYLYQWSWIEQPDPLITITSPTAQSTTLTADAGLGDGTYSGTLSGTVTDTCGGDNQQSVTVEVPIDITIVGAVTSNYFISVQGIPTGASPAAPEMIVTNYEGTITNPTSNISKPVFSSPFDFTGWDTSYDISAATWFSGGSNEAQTAGKLIRSTTSVPDTDDWEEITSNLNSSGEVIRAVLARDGLIMVGGANGFIEISTDNGDTFSVPTLSGKNGSNVIEGFAWDAATGYYYIYQYDTVYRLWESQDGGSTWAQYGTGATNPPTSGYCIGVHNGTAICGTFAGILKRSTDGGDSWTQVEQFNFASDIHRMTTDGAGNWRCVERFGSGISYSTNDGVTWLDIFGWGGAADWITGAAYLEGKGYQEIYRQSSSVPLTLSGTITGTGSKSITNSDTSMKSNLQSGIDSGNYPTS